MFDSLLAIEKSMQATFSKRARDIDGTSRKALTASYSLAPIDRA